jgi:hypothetical protein
MIPKSGYRFSEKIMRLKKQTQKEKPRPLLGTAAIASRNLVA